MPFWRAASIRLALSGMLSLLLCRSFQSEAAPWQLSQETPSVGLESTTVKWQFMHTGSSVGRFTVLPMAASMSDTGGLPAMRRKSQLALCFVASHTSFSAPWQLMHSPLPMKVPLELASAAGAVAGSSARAVSPFNPNAAAIAASKASLRDIFMRLLPLKNMSFRERIIFPDDV